jgi:hypothetical protein
MSSQSASTSQSTSGGSSFIPDYPQSAFLQMVAGEANNYANSAYSRYDSTFQPLENALISDSNKFQSPGYLSQVAGAASSGAGQAGEAQRTNSLRDLQAFGIDPSGGRYAELDKAERGRTAATQAGAAQEAMRQTQQAGRDMRGQALAIGQKNLDRGVQQKQIASSLKFPPLGTAQQSQSTSKQQSSSQPNPNSNSGNKNNPSQQGQQGNNPSGGSGTTWPGMGTGGGGAAWGQAPKTPGGGSGAPNGDGTFGSPVNGTAFDNFSQNNDYINGGQNDPFGYIYDGYNTGGGTNPGADNSTYGSGASPYTPYDPSNINSQGDPSNPWGDNSTPIDNSYTGGGGYSDASSQYTSSGFDNSAPVDNSSSYYDSSGDANYAQGGAIDLQGGGQAPEDASPSEGQQTDDIHANVNADEFVIPKDVALWKGQEFFQNLINKSRQARLTAPAQGSNDNGQPQGQPQPAMG